MAGIAAERPMLVVRARSLGITGIQLMDEDLLRQKIAEAEKGKSPKLNLRREVENGNN
jgi:hypothetical protein